MCEGDLTLGNSCFVLSPVFYKEDVHALKLEINGKMNGYNKVGLH